jgi:hypothetical protein
MKVMLSWSRARSRTVASTLKAWIGDVFQDVEVWMSQHDIDAGARWGSELSAELEACNFGVLCLTAENLDATWIAFEAGSLAKSVGRGRVVPYLIGIKPTDVSGPLAQFQAVSADETGTYKLIQSINEARENQLDLNRLQRLFQKWWPDLKEQIVSLPPPNEPRNVERTDRSILEELLQTMRQLQSQARGSGRASRDRNQNRARDLLQTVVSVVTSLSDDQLIQFSTEMNDIFMGASGDTLEEDVALSLTQSATFERARRGLDTDDRTELSGEPTEE